MGFVSTSDTGASVPGVVVVGSANMDLVFSVDRMPRPGETVLSGSATRNPGGKGLNQVVASARSGAPTQFIGAVGRDQHGDELLRELDAASIGRELVRRVEAPTGQALIVVDSSAENMIVVASGANAGMTTLSDQELSAIGGAAVVLLQLELPTSAVIQAARAGRNAGAVVMLNAAPAAPLAAELLGVLDVLIVNEHEACVIAEVDDVTDASRILAERIPTLIVTLGAEGSAVYQSGQGPQLVEAFAVTAIDSTGAGDTYCGAFAASVAQGSAVIDAVRFATAAAALSVQKSGAVPSIPWRNEVERFWEDQQ